MRKVPVAYLNLPSRDYWVDSGRLPEVRERLAMMMWRMSAATTLLCTGVLELVIRSNLTRSNLDAGLMWLLLGIYVAFTVLWLGKLMMSLRRKN